MEFVSKSRRDWRRDYIEKRREYSKVGVIEYWVINRFQREMTVFYLGEGKRREKVVGEKETYRTKLLPGFELPLAKLLSVADWWK